MSRKKKKKEERGEIEKWGKEQQLARTATSRANVYFNLKKNPQKTKRNKQKNTHTKKSLAVFPEQS